MSKFIATYEDRAKVEAIANTEAGQAYERNGGDAYHRAAELLKAQSQMVFATRDLAVEWLRSEIIADRSFYGQGDISEREDVPPINRCENCTCMGNREIARYTVDDDGICETIETHSCD